MTQNNLSEYELKLMQLIKELQQENSKLQEDINRTIKKQCVFNTYENTKYNS